MKIIKRKIGKKQTKELPMNSTIPKVIKNNEEYQEALTLVEKLIDIDPNPDSKEGILLETWAVLINDYELEKFPTEAPDPVDAFIFRMEQMNKKVINIVPRSGSKNTIIRIVYMKKTNYKSISRVVNNRESLINERVCVKEKNIKNSYLYLKRIKHHASRS